MQFVACNALLFISVFIIKLFIYLLLHFSVPYGNIGFFFIEIISYWIIFHFEIGEKYDHFHEIQLNVIFMHYNTLTQFYI